MRAALYEEALIASFECKMFLSDKSVISLPPEKFPGVTSTILTVMGLS